MLRVHPVQKVPDSPIVVSAPTGKGKVVGKVNLVGAPKNKAATVSNTKTKVAATVAGKVYKGKVKKDGTFVIKIPKLKKGIKFKVTAATDMARVYRGSARSVRKSDHILHHSE